MLLDEVKGHTQKRKRKKPYIYRVGAGASEVEYVSALFTKMDED